MPIFELSSWEIHKYGRSEFCFPNYFKTAYSQSCAEFYVDRLTRTIKNSEKYRRKNQVTDATFVVDWRMNENEFRIFIKHCFLFGKDTVQAKQWLDKCYSDLAPSFNRVWKMLQERTFGSNKVMIADRSFGVHF